MKRLICIFLCIVMSVSCISVLAEETEETTTKRELWTQSSTLTTYDIDELRIMKALEMEVLYLYKLDELGEGYFLAICEHQMTDGGYSGSMKTSYYYYYTLLSTEDSFIIIDKKECSEEYGWGGAHSFVNIRNRMNETYYKNKGYAVPYYMFQPQDKYTNSNYTEHNEYYFIASDANIYKLSENAETGCHGTIFISDSKLSVSHSKYRSSGSSVVYYLSDGTTKANLLEVFGFKSGNITYLDGTKIATADFVDGDLYDIFMEEFDSNEFILRLYKVPKTENIYVSTARADKYNTEKERKYYNDIITTYMIAENRITKIDEYVSEETSISSSITYNAYDLGDLDDSVYLAQGYAVPRMAINDYYILSDGTIGVLSLDSEIYKSTAYYKTNIKYNDVLAVVRTRDGTSSIYHTDPESTSSTKYYWQKINTLAFDKNGKMVLGEDIERKVGIYTGMDGYYSGYSDFVDPVTITSAARLSTYEWWDKVQDNVFDDGRYVTVSWVGMSAGIYEFWYNIFSKDGTFLSTGPTAYSGTYKPDLKLYAHGNTKFTACIMDIENEWIKEYYRIAVIDEGEDGDVISAGSIGEKTITPPVNTDTEIAEPVIDFSKGVLPIGYNIKDGVITTDKLAAELKEQVGAIRLNDVVIIAKSGSVSDYQNTGVTLASFSKYDYSFGDSYIRVYSSGQNLRWYCYNPEKLDVGVYPATYQVGDKIIYITFRVIAPPTNDTATTVVF